MGLSIVSNSLIIQWGSKDTWQYPFTFSIAFSNTSYMIVTSCKNTTASNWETPMDCTITEFKISYANATFNIPINFITIGY